MKDAKSKESNLKMGETVSVLACHLHNSAESIPTLKNRESIHFGFLLRGFVEKELIHIT